MNNMHVNITILKGGLCARCYSYFRQIVILNVLFAYGCANVPIPNTAPPEDFMAKKGSIAIFWLGHVPVAGFYDNRSVWGSLDEWKTTDTYDTALGSSGAYTPRDISLGIQNALVVLDLNSMMRDHYLRVFRSAFEAEGFNVSFVGDIGHPYSQQTLYPRSEIRSAIDRHPVDFSWILDDNDYDYLMIFELRDFGVGRKNFGVAIQPPFGYSATSCSVVDREQRILFHNRYIAEIPIEVEWQSPPKYSAVTAAAAEALENSVDACFIKLFGYHP